MTHFVTVAALPPQAPSTRRFVIISTDAQNDLPLAFFLDIFLVGRPVTTASPQQSARGPQAWQNRAKKRLIIATKMAGLAKAFASGS